MRRTKVQTNTEKRFLIAMIVDDSFLARAVDVFDLSLVEIEYFRIVARWCFDFYKKYGKAPGKKIESIFHFWADQQKEQEDTIDAISDFLSFLSDSYEESRDTNTPFLLDEMGRYLTSKKLELLRDEIDYGLLKGQLPEVLSSVNNFSSVDLAAVAGIDVLNDHKAWSSAFEVSSEPLITFPGAAGRFLNYALVREGLIGIQAPEKRGKTWMCIEFAIRALRSRKKVAVFEIGDLSEGQMLLRFGVRLAKRPLRKTDCGKIKVPKRFVQDETPKKLEFETLDITESITEKSCRVACESYCRKLGIAQHSPYLMLSCHPTSSINVRGIQGVLDIWQKQKDFIPDVIIIDYADVLGPEEPGQQVRDQVNSTWKALRRLSQERKCLIIAPTQADAGSYNVDTQSMENFSEDKRKLAHVTGMLGLNQTPKEKMDNIMRLNWIVLRESSFHSKKCLHIGQCLTLGQAISCSSF